MITKTIGTGLGSVVFGDLGSSASAKRHEFSQIQLLHRLDVVLPNVVEIGLALRLIVERATRSVHPRHEISIYQ